MTPNQISQERAQKIIAPLATCNWRDFPKGKQLVYVNNEWVDAIEFVASELEAVRQEAHQEADKWISVEDRLPESGELVLVFGLGVGFAGAGEVRFGQWWPRDTNVGPHWSAGEGEFREHDAEVTHWMPLPSAPTQNKEEK